MGVTPTCNNPSDPLLQLFQLILRDHMGSTVLNNKIGAWGISGAKPFDFGQSVAYIIGGKIYAAEVVKGFEIYYVDQSGQKQTIQAGSLSGEAQQFTLGSSESINFVSGYYNEYHGEICISQLTFKTKSGSKCGPYGLGGGTAFSVTAEAGKIVGFFGQYGDSYINSIGVNLTGLGNSVTVTSK